MFRRIAGGVRYKLLRFKMQREQAFHLHCRLAAVARPLILGTIFRKNFPCERRNEFREIFFA